MTKTDAKRIKRATTLAELHALADAVLSRARAHSRRVAPKREASVKAKRDARAERNERMAEIRRQVLERSGGHCELCPVPVSATEAHHVIGGGLRRSREGVDTVLALCTAHHLSLHRGSAWTTEQAAVYCDSAGMHDAAAALRKRLDKIKEARNVR